MLAVVACALALLARDAACQAPNDGMLEIPGRHLLTAMPIDTLETPKVFYAFTNFSDKQGMADDMMACKFAPFGYTLNVSNSIAKAITDGYGYNVAQALRMADEQSNWDPNLIYPLSGIFRKGIFDVLVLDRNIPDALRTIHYIKNNLTFQDDPAKPNGGMPATYGYAILYMMDRGSHELAGKTFAIAVQQGDVTLTTCLEALSVAVLDQGCKYVWPVLDAGRTYAAVNNFSSAYDATFEAWSTLKTCIGYPDGTDPNQATNPAFAVDLKTDDYSTQATVWAAAILDGTPWGAGEANLDLYQELIYNNTAGFGNFEKAATAMAVTLIQEGVVSNTTMNTLERVMNEVGCQPLAVPLVDAEGIARAMGTSGTFRRAIATKESVNYCLQKGLLAFQYYS